MDPNQKDFYKAYLLFMNQNEMIPHKNILSALRSLKLVISDSFLENLNAKEIGLDEFERIYNKAKEISIKREKILETFLKYDPKNSGLMDAADLKNVLMNSQTTLLGEADILKTFKYIPPDEHGKICYALVLHHLFGN